MNLFTKQEQTQTSRTNLCLPKGTAGSGVREKQEFGINIYTLLYIKQIISTVLLYRVSN